MKKILLLAIIGIAIATLYGCGEKKITVKGADGTEYDSYQECLAAEDFEAAHHYLAEMENDLMKMDLNYPDFEKVSAYEVAFQETYRKEALFLMSQNDETAKKRILYLLQEEASNEINDCGSYNKTISMLIGLAIDNDDESFVKALGTKYLKRGVKHEELDKLFSYLSSKQSDENKEYLMELCKRLDCEELMSHFY